MITAKSTHKNRLNIVRDLIVKLISFAIYVTFLKDKENEKNRWKRAHPEHVSNYEAPF